MKKWIKYLLVVLVLSLVILQFFQPEKNSQPTSENHIFNAENIPGNIKTDLINACFDCHSNQTNYLWYHKISPISFLVNKHIVDGKNDLNFSEWGKMDVFDKIGKLDEINTETTRKLMPLKSYTLIHSKAKLSDEQREAISKWTESLSEELLEKVSQ